MSRHLALASLLGLALVADARAEPADARAEPAEPAEPIEAAAEVIVVTGTRLPRPVRDVPAAITVLDRAELERSPHVLADDLVRTLPSVGTFRRSSSAIADPTSQGLSLRAVGPSGVSRALVLRDGVPVNDPFGGWVYWRAISPLGLERVEIAPSGASALFGDSALGGIAHLISRPIERASIEAVLAGGSLGTGRGAARVTERFGDTGLALEGELFRTDGYAPIAAAQRGPIDHAAASEHASAGARVEHALGDSRVHVTARYFDESLDAGTALTTADVTTVTYGAGWRTGDALVVELFAGHQRFEQQRARVAPDRTSAELASRQSTPSNNQGALVTWTTRTPRHALVVGADARRVAGTATDVLSPAELEPGSLLERAAGGEQRFLGIFVEDLLHVTARLDVGAALRVDGWHNVSGERTLRRASGERMTTAFEDSRELQLDPRLGAIYRVTDLVALRGSVYRAFRAPTLNELYRPFQVGTVLTAANEALRPETLWGGEAGTQLVTGTVVVRATGFYNRLDDAIANVTLAMPEAGAQRQRQNLGTARIAGLELDASWRPARAWTVSVAHTTSHAEVLAAPAQPELVGKRLAQAPRMRTTAQLAFDEPRLFTASAQLRHLGRQFEDDLNTRSIGGVVLFDARLARRLGAGLTTFVTVQNLLDRRYLVGRAGVDTEGAPRTVELGVAFAR